MNHLTNARRHSFVDCLEPRRLFASTPAVVPAVKETDLVADVTGQAKTTDANLVNPWGIAFNSNLDVIWTANNGTGNSTVYNPDGTIANTGGLYDTITIPPPHGASGTSAPTGEIFNASSAFAIKSGSTTAASAYVFSTEDGTISGWSPAVDPLNAITTVDRSASHAVYKGLAQVTHKGVPFLYATDFHNGHVDVFDGKFKSVHLASKAFTDPKLPAHLAPFGIQNIGGSVYVTYAKQDASKDDDVAGAGNGVVDVYSYKGELMHRLATRGTLNSPWGVVQAPATFGKLAGDLLVGNFGDGKISAFNSKSGKLDGYVGNANGHAIVIDGLWGMTFGPSSGDRNTLFFTAGTDGEAHGLLGTLTAAKAKKATPTSTDPTPIYP